MSVKPTPVSEPFDGARVSIFYQLRGKTYRYDQFMSHEELRRMACPEDAISRLARYMFVAIMDYRNRHK